MDTTRDPSHELAPRCFSFPLGLIHQLDRYAYAKRLSKSSVVRDAVATYLAEREGATNRMKPLPGNPAPGLPLGERDRVT